MGEVVKVGTISIPGVYIGFLDKIAMGGDEQRFDFQSAPGGTGLA
jgi:hypothetical protein